MIKNIKLKIIIGGILGITIISFIAALSMDCSIYGIYIASFDVLATLMWIIVGNYLANDYIQMMKKYENK